jgi:ABC-2 type transport system permease protein
MRRIINIIHQDWTNILRDNILLYIFFAPILMAVLVRVLLPSLDTLTLRLAVNQEMPACVRQRLAQYGQVEIHPDRSSLETRVLQNDDVPGFYWEADRYEILLQGNEPEGEKVSRLVLQATLSPPTEKEFDITFTRRPRESRLGEYGLIFTLLMSILLGAVTEAFNMVQDKESGLIRAWAVSPLRMAEMTAARALFSVVAGAVMTLLAVLIVTGVAAPWGQISIGFLASSGIAILVGFFLGGFSNTQLQMMALMKVVLMGYSLLPLLSIFLPRAWHVLFYPFPNYWMFLIFENIFIGQNGPVGFWGACGLTLAAALIYLGIMFPLLRRRLRFE